MRLLIVEDEVKSAAYLKKGLEEHGFVVDVANDGETGLYLAINTYFDIIILDVMLPTLDGWHLLQRIRKENKKIPVLMLTARDSVQDRVKGLELGADDYLLKPFAFSELLARLKALSRRCQQIQAETFEIADLKIDFLKHKAERQGQRLDLTPKEFALLSLLARHKGELLSRTMIAEQVWDMNFDSDTNIVDVAIRRLRLKVDHGFQMKLIHTIRGAGYVLEDRK